MKLASLLLAGAMTLSPAAYAVDWTLDKSHTFIGFSVNHLGFSETRGTFSEFDAEISYDPADISSAAVTFTIDAASINTFWEARDNHVKGADFLDVENHPTITFVSTGVTSTGENTATLTGDMTIKGTTQEVSFDVTKAAMAANPFNPALAVAGFQLVGEIDRTDFGINFGAPAIGAVMPITIDLEINAPADSVALN
ncbi:MAG: YceI family protein [Pseudomonadota bacterium]